MTAIRKEAHLPSDIRVVRLPRAVPQSAFPGGDEGRPPRPRRFRLS